MSSQVTATDLGGMLKPDQELPLADHTRVKLTIEPIGEAAQPAQGSAEGPAVAATDSGPGTTFHAG